MKVGDLVKLNETSYPQYKGKVGVLVDFGTMPSASTPWIVMINGKPHTFFVKERDMELVDESR